MDDGRTTSAVPQLRPPGDLRTQLLAQKTHLIGELAESINNQFNNIMMSVTSYAELELKKAPPAARQSLEHVLHNARRATHLIQQLLAFSRSRTPTPKLLHLNQVVTELQDLLRQMLGEKVKLVMDLSPEIGAISADPVELQELLLTLAVHARNAMGGRGTLYLETMPAELDRNGSRAGDETNSYVALCVRDSGPNPEGSEEGFDGAHQEFRISLTLAAINRIVTQAQGLVKIASVPRQGTKFSIYFPAVEEEEFSSDDVLEKELNGSKTVLIVEDDDAVRVPAAEFLKMEGFKVLQANTGAEAIHIARQWHLPVHLLITDIFMPGMSGREVALQLSEMYAGMKVLYMSGDTSAVAMANSTPENVLQKPFRLEKLNDRIRDLLGE